MLSHFAPRTHGFWPLVTRAILRDAVWFGQGATDGLSMWFSQPLSFQMGIPYRSALTVLIGLTGWVSFAVIVSALLFFIIKGMLRCFRQKSSLGLLVASAVMLTFSVQAIGYVVYNLGFQIVRPVSLPLVVSGNAALIVNMVLVGFMLSVFRTGDAVVDKAVRYNAKDGKIFAWENGKLIIDFKTITGS